MAPNLLVFHDESGSTHPNSCFVHAVALVKAERIELLQAELARLRERARCNSELQLKWNKCSDNRRNRGVLRLAGAFMDWYETDGHRLIGFDAIVFDRSAPEWSDNWVARRPDHTVYNVTAASTVAHAISFLEPHRPEGIVVPRMYSDYRKRAVSDDFQTAIPAKVPFKCKKAVVQFDCPVDVVGAASDPTDPEVAMALEVIQFVDLFAGMSYACSRPEQPAGRGKTWLVGRFSEWLNATRPLQPTGRFGNLKRSVDVQHSPGRNGQARDRWFDLPHMPKRMSGITTPGMVPESKLSRESKPNKEALRNEVKRHG